MKKILLLVLSVTWMGWTQSAELVVNGSMREAPEPSALPGVQNHSGAYVWPMPNGSTAVAGWTASGKVCLIYPKNNRRRTFDMNGAGGISQKLNTVPGHQYSVQFLAARNGEGGSAQTLRMQFGNESRQNLVPQGRYFTRYTYRLTASAAQTMLTLSGTAKGGGGPVVTSISVKEFDPAETAVSNALSDIYRGLDRAEKNEADIDKHMGVLAPDFTYKPGEGDIQSRESYENGLRLKAARTPTVHTVIESLDITPEGANVTVERRTVVNGDYGKTETDSSRFLHTWTKSGDVWKLKSSQEL